MLYLDLQLLGVGSSSGLSIVGVMINEIVSFHAGQQHSDISAMHMLRIIRTCEGITKYVAQLLGRQRKSAVSTSALSLSMIMMVNFESLLR